MATSLGGVEVKLIPFVLVILISFGGTSVFAQRSVKVVGKPGKAASRQRIALVIGNGSYKSGPLRNPRNDARDMAAVLSKRGFRVTLLLDARQRAMEKAIRGFGRQLRGGGCGAVLLCWSWDAGGRGQLSDPGGSEDWGRR